MDRYVLVEIADAVRARDRVKTRCAGIEHHVEHAVAESLAAGISKATIARAVGWSPQRINGYITRHREDIEEMRATCARLHAIFAGMQRHRAMLERAAGIRTWRNRGQYGRAEIEARQAKTERLLDTARKAVENRAKHTDALGGANRRVTLTLVAAHETGATQVAIADAAGWKTDRVRKRLKRQTPADRTGIGF